MLLRTKFVGAVAVLGLVGGVAHADSVDAQAAPRPQLDVLFVVDNSASMLDEQVRLAAEFPTFVTTLESVLGVRPDLHVGVISSNAGAGGYAIQACIGDGDDGKLQHEARVDGCTPPSDPFLSDVAMPDGTRAVNYQGDIGDAFACIAQLGTDGCGFEQHLESMKRALDGNQPDNAGFLRQDAHLAVIVLADEDDCSASDPSLYDPSLTGETELGALNSFRCTEYGVICAEGLVARAVGEYTECVPRYDSPYLRDPREFAEFLRALKTEPDRLFVAAIVGPSDPFRVEIGANSGKPELDNSCTNSDLGGATPAVRLQAFLAQFPARNAVASVCGAQVSLAPIASALAAQLNGSAPPVPDPPDAGPAEDEPDGGPETPPPADGDDGGKAGCRIAAGGAGGAGGAGRGAGFLGLTGMLGVLAFRRRRRRV